MFQNNDNHTDFLSSTKGRFTALLSWKEFDEFWENLFITDAADWYIYQIGEIPPQKPLSEAVFTRFCKRLVNKLKREHKEDYCGIVYVDDKSSPSFIKIYNPSNLGVVCGFSDQPPLPGWTISKIKPVDLIEASKPKASAVWWKRLLPAKS